MSFSPEWLGLREPVDHRSRSASVASALQHHFASKPSVRVLDLGCGTGSNLRASIPFLPQQQEWLLIDYDATLLQAARVALLAQGGTQTSRGAGAPIAISNEGKQIGVQLQQFDLSAGIRPLIDHFNPDVVTASAFFDLVSASFLHGMAQDLAATRTAFYTVLTYDGEMRFAPHHSLDAVITSAFNTHQQTDKGFGTAAGPNASRVLELALAAAGAHVITGTSPWDMGLDDAALTAPLTEGIAQAARETGLVPPTDCQSWLAKRLEGLNTPNANMIVGHTDIFAYF